MPSKKKKYNARFPPVSKQFLKLSPGLRFFVVILSISVAVILIT